ncbi:GNAT family N-acetyltransferase [Bacillus sp. FJAT-50079]|uniref:GNAT family N-acetyltransferase n=1 Tax=Bacillus sp. FJAT-50079 TaxID=2833577 RepID=UPI001BCA35CC|nr:GNAT family N-acetyltransferase [Bacillus sp. FJAT-50079]MBS4209443.1 GNAT family N-acetyltransferase [Bacillus sp. FJAT-50079]
MKIRGLHEHEQAPMDLLLLADPSPEKIEDYVNKGECFLAEKDGEMIGVYVLLPIRIGVVELVNIAIREEQQGNGLGKQLVMDAIQRAKRKYKVIEVGTGNSSIGPLALYQKCGFRIIGIDRDFFIRHYQQKIVENGIQCRDMIRLSLDL